MEKLGRVLALVFVSNFHKFGVSISHFALQEHPKYFGCFKSHSRSWWTCIGGGGARVGWLCWSSNL